MYRARYPASNFSARSLVTPQLGEARQLPAGALCESSALELTSLSHSGRLAKAAS
jgi:hypothetical protein